MADIGVNAAGRVPPWVDTIPWRPSGLPEGAVDRAAAHRHAFDFSASGREYFRVWIVNLIVTVLSLGVFYPWAKVRRLRYFHRRTRLGGQPFDFHARPRRMLRGFLLVALGLAVYQLASRMSPLAASIGLLAGAVLAPALWRASLRFRLGHTSWNGLPFAFEGSAAGAYGAFVPAILAGGAALLLLTAGAEERLDSAALAVRLLAVAGLAALAAPAAWHALKRYQHGHLALADRRSAWRASRRETYGLLARAAAVGGATLAALALLGAASAAALAGDGARPGTGLAVLPVLAGIALLQLLPGAYLQARTQDLVWNRTEASGLRFESRLAFRALLGLRLKNLLLVALTLGLYWPWAAVATARLRLAAVTVLSDEPLDRLAGDLRAAVPADASGDAAADLAGLDFGL